MGLSRRGVLIAALALSNVAPAHGAEPRRSDEQRLAQLFADDLRRSDELDPLSTLSRGGAADPRALAQLFTDSLDKRRLASAQQSLQALARIDRGALRPERRISYDTFAYTKRQEVAWLRPDRRALVAVRPFNHFGGLHVDFPSLVANDGVLPFANETDYRRALALEAAFAVALDNAVAQFRRGLRSGVVEPRLTVVNMIAQIDALLAQGVERSPFHSPVANFPAGLGEAQRAELRVAFAATIRDRIFPAYRRLRAFLAEEYLPAAREQVGLSAMRGGTGLYRDLIERQTTLKLPPDEIHRLGRDEVSRIQRDMETVKAKLGFAGPLRAFFDRVRVEPRYHPKSREELADGFAAVARTVERQIPRFFNRVPKTQLLIQPYPAYREKFEAGGSYNQGSPDAARAGVFFFNTYDLPSRFLTGMTTLYLHEGIPGHHFQISLALENEDLPPLQRFDGNTAYVEGWALYAETLGYDMGLYADPMQHWGTLDDEMLRAMRLVVDTGLHAQGWSREQAIEYMLANSGMGRTDATAEVERYIANPAQALAYKLGGLAIQRLRRRAEAELGAKFDIRAFHDQVLGSGALPLPILEAKIDAWIMASR